MTKIKPFVDKYNWKGINYPSETNDSQNLKKFILQLVLIFYILKRKTYPAFVFKHNLNRQKEFIILMI